MFASVVAAVALALLSGTVRADDGKDFIADARVFYRVVVRGVTGYAAAWNTGFGGVLPAEVVLV